MLLYAETSATLPSAVITNVACENLILGLNYSGVHDSAVALVAPDGEVRSACALERISRIKQDGRPPDALLANMDWNKIASIAVSADEWPWSPLDPTCKVHPTPLSAPRDNFLVHGQPFYDYLANLPKPKQFFCHHLSHVASAFWPSGFDEALCLTYDGGIFNSPWFGGLYKASREHGIEPLDRFASSHYAKITSLYSAVTALLGFTPNKHEGKITGLAAYGSPNAKCRDVLEELFTADFRQTEEVLEWFHSYSSDIPPVFWVHEHRRQELLARFQGLRREDIAHAVQAMAEEHVLEILRRAERLGWRSPAICLAGGLFANVKINQRVKEFGFQRIFIAPPMTDDGTAVGAALLAASESPEFHPRPARHMFLGPSFGDEEIRRALDEYCLRYTKVEHPEPELARALSSGKVVALFQGRMEFGPRALGNRSILSAATDPGINHDLNARLRRTEFMPFAPITRVEDLESCYTGLEGAGLTAEFMTITTACTDRMRHQASAVVHVDGTARPQLVCAEVHPLLHAILTAYHELTGIPSLINTSFNVHEEPIVCTPQDALQGFLEASLDLLYLEGGYLVTFAENLGPAIAALRRKMTSTSRKEQDVAAVARVLDTRADSLARELEARALVVKDMQAALEERGQVMDGLQVALEERGHVMDGMQVALDERLASMLEKEKVIESLAAVLRQHDKWLKWVMWAKWW